MSSVLLSSVFYAISLPTELAGSHLVCEACLYPVPKPRFAGHNCIFRAARLHLRAGGWSSDLSRLLRADIRGSRPRYRGTLLKILKTFLSSFIPEGGVLVPVPTGNISGVDPWREILESVALDLPRVQVSPIILRHKNKSARKSVAQIRGEIVRREYSIDKELAAMTKGVDRLYVLDDNVTTGHTIVHCSGLIAQTLGCVPVPVCLDRTVSARILQRCESPTGIKEMH